MKFSAPLLVKPSRNLTMSLAGKSEDKQRRGSVEIVVFSPAATADKKLIYRLLSQTGGWCQRWEKPSLLQPMLLLLHLLYLQPTHRQTQTLIKL